MSAVADTEARAHHPYSPSTLQSIEACPNYRSKSSTHLRTIIGTISHKVTETREDDNRLTDDDAAAAAECLDFYDGRVRLAQAARHFAIQELQKSFEGVKTPVGFQPSMPQVIELTETYLPIDDCKYDDADSTTAGFVDRVLITHCRTYAELFDWKFGMWPVEKAENNLQGIAYVLGLFRKYPSLKGARFFFKQPNTGAITNHYFARETVAQHYLRIMTVVERARRARKLAAKGDWSMANPTVPNCLFCANIAECTKILAFAIQTGKKFDPLRVPDDITPTKIHSTRDTKDGLALCAVMGVWAAAYRGRITDRVIRRDADVPDGFTLTTGSKRSVTDVKKLREVSQQYLTKEEYDALLSQEPPFGTLEQAVQDKAPRGQKAATLREFQTKIIESGAVTKGDPYTYLKAVAKSD